MNLIVFRIYFCKLKRKKSIQKLSLTFRNSFQLVDDIYVVIPFQQNDIFFNFQLIYCYLTHVFSNFISLKFEKLNILNTTRYLIFK